MRRVSPAPSRRRRESAPVGLAGFPVWDRKQSQRHMLLACVEIAVLEASGHNWARHRELHRFDPRQLEPLHQRRIDAIQLANLLGGQHVRVPDVRKVGVVAKKNVEGDSEGAGGLRAEDLRYLAKPSGLVTHPSPWDRWARTSPRLAPPRPRD